MICSVPGEHLQASPLLTVKMSGRHPLEDIILFHCFVSTVDIFIVLCALLGVIIQRDSESGSHYEGFWKIGISGQLQH